MTKKKYTLSATTQGLELAVKALQKLYGTQTNFAVKLTGEVGRSTIQKFFQGEKILIDKFKEICKGLELESQWQKIAGLADLPELVDFRIPLTEKPAFEKQDNSVDINALVQEARKKVKPYYKNKYGTIKVLGMREPVKLELVYTTVQFLDDEAILSFESIENLEKFHRRASRRGFQSQDKGKQPGIKVANDKKPSKINE
jgi:hypothetical protein